MLTTTQPAFTADSKDTGFAGSLTRFRNCTAKWLLPLLLILFIFLLFLFPQIVFESLLHGFKTAFCRVIPAVFPMMVLSGMLIDSPLTGWLGILFLPVTRSLGIRERSAATVFFLGLLGGFSVLALGIDQLYRARRIDRHQAELLLCAGMNAGPSFILLSVGHNALGNLSLGIILFSCICAGNILSALLLHFFTFKRNMSTVAFMPHCLDEGFPQNGSFSRSMQRAVNACATLCGYIAFFCLASDLVKNIIPLCGDLLSATLEITNGVMFATALPNPYRLPVTAAVLSWCGLSIHLQATALLPPEISLRKFYLSRLLALPVSLTLYGLFIKLFPQILPAMAAYSIRPSRFSPDIVISFFLMLIGFFYECTPKKTLRHS